MKKVVLKVDIHDGKDKQKAMKKVFRLQGINSIAVDMKEKKMTVTGDVDPVDIVSRLRKFKFKFTEIVSVGPEKEPEKEKEKEPEKDSIDDLLAELMKAYNPYYNYTPYNYYVIDELVWC